MQAAVTEGHPLIEGFIEGFRPAPDQTVSEWADANVVLTSELASEPGPFRTDRVPFMREMMDVLADPAVEIVVYHTSTQVSKTTAIMCGIGYYMAYDPCPMLMILPDKGVAEAFSKAKMAPFINGTPILAERCGLAGTRDNSSTIYRKEFPGGFLNIAGANTPSALAMQSVRMVLADEVDRYKASAGVEGDPIELAYKRAQTFRGNRKLVASSTPTNKGVSKIDAMYEKTDKRTYRVPLPCCDQLQALVWENVKWKEGHPETAEYCCAHCGTLNSDADVRRACIDPAARWVPENPEIIDRVGFHIWQIYSPFSSMEEIVRAWEEMKDDPNEKKVFYNTYLGESYDGGEAIKTTAEIVHANRIAMPEHQIPRGAAVMTAGVDIQANRIEVLFLAHGPLKQMWMVRKVVIDADPTADGAWDRLEELLAQRWTYETHPHIARSLAGAAIDSGYLTQRVYDFAAKAHAVARPWYAVKGIEGEGKIAWDTSEVRLKHGAKLHLVGIDSIKTEIHSRLATFEGTSSRIYVRQADNFDLATIEQLFAEKVRLVVDRKGFGKREWHKLPGKRNELLDMTVYGEAVHRHLNPDHQGILNGLTVEKRVNMAELAGMFSR